LLDKLYCCIHFYTYVIICTQKKKKKKKQKKKKKKKIKEEKEVEREPKERINIIYTHLDVIKFQFLLYSSAFEEVLFL